LKILGLNLLFFGIVSSVNASIPTIKVRVGKDLDQVKVSGIDIQKKINGQQQVKSYNAKKSIHFNCSQLQKLPKLNEPLLLASLTSPTGLIRWEQNAYQGSLNLVASEGHRGCDLINEISLEKYLTTLLAKEMNASWPIEALKAQAVAARSYAFHKIVTQQVSRGKGFKTYYDLENSEKHQVNGTFFDATKNTELAAKQTEGEVLTTGRSKVSPIFFHAKCGGKTLTPAQVWTSEVEGYRSVECPFCHDLGKKEWELVLPEQRFNLVVDKVLKNFYSDKLNKKNLSDVKLMPDHKGKSQVIMYEDDRLLTIQKSRLRSVLGTTEAPSNYFHMEVRGKDVVLKGKGHGHGVGMCQLGALALAKKGFNYRQILSHYFPEHKLEKIY
jgi:stage II sporulation protein D